MIRFKIQAVKRAGHKGAWRAGRFFSSAEEIVVVVHDQDEDPPTGDIKATPYEIGRKSWAQIKDDGKLRIIPDGDPLRLDSAEVQNLRAMFDSSWEALKASHAFEIEAEKAKRVELEQHATKLENEAIATFEKIATLQQELTAKTQQIAELEQQLGEQLENETPAEAPSAKRSSAPKSVK